MSPQRLTCADALTLIVTLDAHTRITWGYAPDCDVRPPDLSVSRRHGGLLVQDAQLVIEDHSSCNGSVIHCAGLRHPLHAASWSAPLPLLEPIIVYIGRVPLTITQRGAQLILTTPS